MKSRSSELLDKSTSAMIAAIEIYNKPDFLYRGGNICNSGYKQLGIAP